MQNSEMDSIANGAKTADRRSLGFPRGVGGEGSPALYCNVLDTTSQRVETGFNPHQIADDTISAFSRLPKNCKHKSTDYLTEAKMTDIVLGAKTAHDIGRPFNQYITIRLDPDASPERPQDILADYLARLRRKLAKHGCRVTYFWILENPVGKTLHAHMFLHIPPELLNNTKDGFRSWQQRAWYRAGVKLNAEPGILLTKDIYRGDYNSKTASDEERAAYNERLRGLLKYHCKAIDPGEKSSLSPGRPALELFGVEHKNQGTIHGRRYSLSMDIREAARTQLWLNSARTDFKAHTAPLMTK